MSIFTPPSSAALGFHRLDMAVLGVGSKAALAADRTFSGVGLASGSPHATEYLFFAPWNVALGGEGHGCKYLEEEKNAAVVVVVVAAAAAAVVVVVVGCLLLEHAPSINTFKLPSSAAPGFRRHPCHMT